MLSVIGEPRSILSFGVNKYGFLLREKFDNLSNQPDWKLNIVAIEPDSRKLNLVYNYVYNRIIVADPKYVAIDGCYDFILIASLEGYTKLDIQKVLNRFGTKLVIVSDWSPKDFHGFKCSFKEGKNLVTVIEP